MAAVSTLPIHRHRLPATSILATGALRPRPAARTTSISQSTAQIQAARPSPRTTASGPFPELGQYRPVLKCNILPPDIAHLPYHARFRGERRADPGFERSAAQGF